MQLFPVSRGLCSEIFSNVSVVSCCGERLLLGNSEELPSSAVCRPWVKRGSSWTQETGEPRLGYGFSVPLVRARRHPGKQQPELFGGGEGTLEAPKVRVDVNLKLPGAQPMLSLCTIVTSAPATSAPQPSPKPCASSCRPASGPGFWQEGHKWSGFWSQTLWV